MAQLHQDLSTVTAQEHLMQVLLPRHPTFLPSPMRLVRIGITGLFIDKEKTGLLRMKLEIGAKIKTIGLQAKGLLVTCMTGKIELASSRRDGRNSSRNVITPSADCAQPQEVLGKTEAFGVAP